MDGEITAFVSLASYKFKKILLNKRVVAALAVAVIVVGVMAYASTQDVERLQDGTILLDVMFLTLFLPVLVMLYSTSVIREEIEDKSITQVIASPMKRITAYLSYYSSLLLALFLLMGAIFTAGFLSFFIPQGLDVEALYLYRDMFLLVVIGCVVYSALFLLVSVIIERAIYFGLFYAFIWESFIGSLPGRIAEFSVRHYIRSIGAGWIEFMEFGNATGVLQSFMVLFVVFVIMMVAGALLFRQKEYPC